METNDIINNSLNENMSNFLITDYIKQLLSTNTTLESLLQSLYSQGILSKDYPDEGLILIYNNYSNKNIKPMVRECRSIILDRNTFEIVCYTCNTPIYNLQAIKYLLDNSELEKKTYRCYEGTLLSLFNHNNKWFLSTRRCLDSNNSVWKNKSYFNFFMEVLQQDGYTFDEFTNLLDKNIGYYFILLHHENKNIIDYTYKFGSKYKKLCLAFIRDKKTQLEIKLKMEFVSEHIFLAEELDNLTSFDKINKKNDNYDKPQNEGIIIKIKNCNKLNILKLQNINYQFALATGPENNIFRGFIYLYQTDKLIKYFKNNPNFIKYKKIINPINLNESYDTIGVIDATFKICTSELYELFKLLWNFKTSKHQNGELYNILTKEYKNILFAIRGIYFKKKI